MNYDFNLNELFRALAATAGGWIWANVGPALPFGAVCTAMVLADFITSRRLARRLARTVPDKAAVLRFSSAKFGRTISTLGRIYAMLVLAAMVDSVILGTGWLLKFAAGAVCLWQAVSILENEAACNGSRWARMARRIIIDKTERHLGVTLDELRSQPQSEKGGVN